MIHLPCHVNSYATTYSMHNALKLIVLIETEWSNQTSGDKSWSLPAEFPRKLSCWTPSGIVKLSVSFLTPSWSAVVWLPADAWLTWMLPDVSSAHLRPKD